MLAALVASTGGLWGIRRPGTRGHQREREPFPAAGEDRVICSGPANYWVGEGSSEKDRWTGPRGGSGRD